MLAERKRIYTIVLMVMYIPILLVLIRFAQSKSLVEVIKLSGDITYLLTPVVFNSRTLKVCIIGTLFYFVFCAGFVLNIKNYRFDEEYGSAKFGNPRKLNRKYRSKGKENDIKPKIRNMCLTATVNISLNMYYHLRNLNLLIFGGSGTGKTRGYILPMLLRANCNFVVTDPKGEILAAAGKFLKLMGYDVRVLDLKNHNKSFCYNPFNYFRGDDDILKYVNQTWAAMSDKTAAKGEQIWDDQAKNVFISLIMYLYHYAPKEEQNYDTLIKMVQQIKGSEDGKAISQNAIDVLFDSIDKNTSTYGYYKGWSAAKGRTLDSIVATLTAKLTVFNLESLRKLTMCDELNILDLAAKKVALFMVIPDNDTSYNFIAGTLYSQMFQHLYEYADNICNGKLPRHVRFMMDEFANVALPDDYEKILSTARSRNMSFAIVLQNKSQIEALYEKVYKSLIGNCDELLFLGSSEYETCKYFSDLLDKETVYVKTVNITKGANASATVNTQKTGRELMTAGELRNLSNDKCVLLIRGEDPVIDKKINLTKCKNYKYLADGRRTLNNLYDWGRDESKGGIRVISNNYSGYITPLPKISAEIVN